MKSRLFDHSIVSSSQEALDFISNILESSTEYSIIGQDLAGMIVLWNEGARRLYGYEPEEVVGKANTLILHTADDVDAGVPDTILASVRRDGKWAGQLERVRKNGKRFTASVVVTLRYDGAGQPIGTLLISKDISEDIRLAEEVKATQFYTRSLIESNIDALMTTDPLGIITDVNQQMETLTGYSREELIGSPFKTYFTDPARAESGIKLVLRRGEVTNYELTARAKDGRETVVSYNASTFRDAAGRLQGVFAAARDITEQQKLEGQLRDSEAYNRGLIEASVDGLITVDPAGTISDVNEQMCRMSGYAREELIGSPFADYFADAQQAAAGVNETFEKGIVTDYVLTLAHQDGRQLRVSFNASVFRDPSGAIRGIFASARDITEQAQLQEQLAEERAYNRGLIEASLDGLVTVDPALAITDVNEQMCRMTGYSREQLIGSPFKQYFTDPKRAAEGVRLTLDQGAVTNYELTLRAQDGHESLVSFNAAIFKDQTGAVRGIFASARDITDQAQLQAQLAEERTYNRGLIEASVDGLLTVDEAMLITDVNETMCRMVGRRRNQLIGSSFTGYFTERERAAEGVALTFNQGAVTNYVLTLESADGQQVPVSFNAAIFEDSAGRVRGIFASARDITAQKQLEDQLQISQTYTRSLIESNIDALMTTDPLGIITDVNQQMETLTGYSREELIGSPFKTYFTDPKRAESGIKLVLGESRVTNYELTARAKDGKETVVSYNATTFYDRNGKLQGVFAAARDITEQKQLEQQLREQQTYLRGLIESSVDGLITVDPDGFISDINEQMCRMSGYTRSELIGTPFADYFTDAERARAGVEQTFKNGIVTEYALTIVSRTRRLLQVSFNASVFKEASGSVRGIFASARDITDRVRLEEQMREQQTYLRGLIESSLDGLITVDPDGFITDVNEQMCRMSDYSREKLVGSPFKQYFTDPARADSGVKRTFAEGMVTNYQLVLRTKAQHKATVSFNASIFRAGDGRVEGIFASARDISEQARLQNQLAEQQVYNRSLIEASADALFAIAPDGTITDVNAEATRLTGYSRKHLVNSSFSGYFTDPQEARSGVQQTLDAGRVLGYELVLITRYGRRITVSFNAGVFTDTAGAPLGIMAGARDITEQKTLELQLRDQQFYTRSLIESNIDALMTTDPLGIITDVNQQMETLTSYSREELIGSPFKTYFTDPERAESGIKLVLGESKVTNYELTARGRDGRDTVVSYNAATFYDRNGELQGVFAAARDVTERKRAEERFRRLLESAPDPMVIVNKDGEIVLVNSQTERLFGYTREELLGQRVEMLMPEQSRGRHSSHRSSYYGNPRVRPMGDGLELYGRRKDGSLFPIEISLSPLETEEGMLVTSVIRDITERRRFERTLQEKNVELENANLAKDRFLASMSHELRTPLNAIIGFTGTMLMQLPGPLNHDQDEQLTAIETSANHLLSLINDLLDLAKIESGKVELSRAPVLCQDVLHDISTTLRPMAEAKGLHFEVDAPQRDLVLQTDRRALSQILLNLANNALKFTEHGEVRLVVERRRVDGHRIVELTVSDTGIGIQPEDRARLFQAFEQLHTGVVRRHEGTGLGLHLSQKLANLLGGAISCQSEFGVGSTFTLQIPEK